MVAASTAPQGQWVAVDSAADLVAVDSAADSVAAETAEDSAAVARGVDMAAAEEGGSVVEEGAWAGLEEGWEDEKVVKVVEVDDLVEANRVVGLGAVDSAADLVAVESLVATPPAPPSYHS